MSEESKKPEPEAEDLSDDALEAEAAATVDETETESPAGKSVEQLEAELDDLRNRLLRAAADAENTRKRAQRDVKDTRDYAITGFARDMLDVADNLSRAVAAMPDDARADAPDSVKTLIEGVEMTERRLLSTLERHGVKRIDPEPGDSLDPNRHQAAAQIPADQPKGKIAHVMQPGYIIGERTLRAAMVVVSAGPAEGGASSQADGDKPEAPDGGVDVSA
ncbi:nucleotide exchange factor GrpE [Marinicauda sp. Alg238-R41]|uniref:nucleotide exchange factor GrpE n=1 Tax=Marinicauda sp. Alg238-R41 TaxID=2993447 RepID=UPI0022E29FC4|nr:nucleotide exchange factor GrpE [Marinicauda sp. Alg238-R41]